jgi:hypothetical protein
LVLLSGFLLHLGLRYPREVVADAIVGAVVLADEAVRLLAARAFPVGFILFSSFVSMDLQSLYR